MKIALAGFGQEGRASYDYWNVEGNELTIVDERSAIDDAPAGVATITGPDAFSKLGDFDLIIRSPGINPRKLPYGEKVWSATNEFFAKCPAPIIGVTGTKGKGTTCSLITSILKAAGRNVHLVGNIGTPALTELPRVSAGDIVVYELSSFQLWDVKKSPHIAMVLMIEPDHLDVHDSMEDYLEAKANITRFQDPSDMAYYNPHNEKSKWIAEAAIRDGSDLAVATVYPYMDLDEAHIKNGKFYFRTKELCGIDKLKLPGFHNLENTCAAITACVEAIGIDKMTSQVLEDGLAQFDGLSHRLKFVAEKNGVKFYDDSIATTPGSAIAAIRSFEQPKVLILGGHDKGADYTELLELCATTETKVLAIGANGDDIAAMCEQLGVTYERETGDMTAIVTQAYEVASEGDVVMLSPAAASFDMFKSYADRGDQFIAAVNALDS